MAAKGWGRLTLTGSAKRGGAAWTDDGAAVDQRQLKHRARDAVRVVPIPPVLVAILRDHIERFGTAADGRLFQVTWGQRGKGGLLTTKVYGPVWQKACAAALTRAQQASCGLEYTIVAVTCSFSQQGVAVRRRSGTRA